MYYIAYFNCISSVKMLTCPLSQYGNFRGHKGHKQFNILFNQGKNLFWFNIDAVSVIYYFVTFNILTTVNKVNKVNNAIP